MNCVNQSNTCDAISNCVEGNSEATNSTNGTTTVIESDSSPNNPSDTNTSSSGSDTLDPEVSADPDIAGACARITSLCAVELSAQQISPTDYINACIQESQGVSSEQVECVFDATSCQELQNFCS